MLSDGYGLATSSTVPAAAEAFGAAVHALGAHRPETGAALARTLDADPGHVAALALKGFANLILARQELVPVAAEALAAARAALGPRDGGTADERVLVAALAAAVAGSFARAADLIDTGFADRPAAFLPFKLSHALRFMIGDRGGMLRASDRMLAAWEPGGPGAGFLLGCHAFALEEHGAWDAAERFGRRAVAIQPEDAWGRHAVSHVHEMQGQTRTGISWLEEGRADWSRCNNFAFHMAWHLALFHLEAGDGAAALSVYDREVRPVQTDDFRDLANAVSLLWRFDRSGLATGRRWADLAEVAGRRRTDTTLVFAQLHALVALVALGDRAGVAELLAALADKAAGTGDQAGVAACVGLPLARILASEGTGAHAGGAPLPLDRLAAELPRIGGSHAQRDLFLLALAEAANRSADPLARLRIGAARRRLKAEDRLIAAVDRVSAGREAGTRRAG